MKKFLFLALLLIISCESSNDSERTIKIYKCLLLDSDVTTNYITDLVDAVKAQDALKLASVFSTIYPAIGAEYIRCQNSVGIKSVRKEEEQKEEKDEQTTNIFEMLLKLFKQYVLPMIKELGQYLAKLCKKAFPESNLCDLLDFF